MRGRTVGLLLDRGDVLLVDLEVHGDTGRLDGDSTLLFVFSCVRKPHVSSLRARNDTSLGDEGVGKSGLSVIDYVVGEACMLSDVLRVIERDRRTMSNNTHVTDVGGLVHKGPDLVCRAYCEPIRAKAEFCALLTYCEVTGIVEGED